MNTNTVPVLSLADVQAARRRLEHGLRVTPCQLAPALTELTGIRIWLKREDLQRTGSFKERGARLTLLSLSEAECARGVIAASAGNHALGLAYHGAQLGVTVTVVMPRSAPDIKVARCRSLGANVLLRGDAFDEAYESAVGLANASGSALVHPFDDPVVMAGQGTVALEVLEQARELDTLVVPVGGGGLLAGVVTVVKALRPEVRVIAVESENAASFRAALRGGEPILAPVQPTLADGLAVARVGRLAFHQAAPLVDDVVTVTEHDLAAAIAVLARKCGAVVEGAGAAPLAAVLAGKIAGRSIVLPIGGRNIDARLHAAVLASQSDEDLAVKAA